MMTIRPLLAAFTLVAAFSTSAFGQDGSMPDASAAGMNAMPGMGLLSADAFEPVPDAAFLSKQGARLGDLYLYNAFTRAMPPGARAGGGFVTIYNAGSENDRLVSASSSAAAVVQLHTMIVKDGVMIMREVENGIDIPAGKAVALKPGGFHIMFIDAVRPFAEGKTVPVTLTFEKAGAIMLDLPVGALGSTTMPVN